MSIPGIMTSPSQKRAFLLASVLILVVSCILTWAIYYFTDDTRGWNLVVNFFLAIVTSGVFALASALYLTYFFVDPFEIASATKLLPQDIAQALTAMAKTASDYKLFVRTGRHFRAEILPLLIKNAIQSRRQIRIEAVLLDFRDNELCQKYATYRASSSFDSKVWTKEYVQKEVLATILALIEASKSHSSLIKIDLYLSKRLSTFRIDGSSDEVIVTREDPKDTASHYRRTDNDYSAFMNEFNWARDAAAKTKQGRGDLSLPATLEEMFDNNPLVAGLTDEATKATTSRSPYAR